MTGKPKKGNPFAVIREKDDKTAEGKTQTLESFSKWNQQKVVGNGLYGVQTNAQLKILRSFLGAAGGLE